jgi:hypothetical protein
MGCIDDGIDPTRPRQTNNLLYRNNEAGFVIEVR